VKNLQGIRNGFVQFNNKLNIPNYVKHIESETFRLFTYMFFFISKTFISILIPIRIKVVCFVIVTRAELIDK